VKVVTATLRVLVTLAATAGAVYGGFLLWQYYMESPWTRDARVAAEFVKVAPDISGWVSEVRVTDNQPVKKGDILFTIEKDRFAIAVKQAQALFDQQAEQTAEYTREYQRRLQLHSDSISVESLQQSGSKAKTAESAVEENQAALAKAKLDLDRTDVRAPVDGIVSFLTVKKGDYASAGHVLVAMIAAGSFHVRGYFEETKLSRINVDDRVVVRLMSYSQPLDGHIESIGSAIVDREVTVDSSTLIPNVNPTFSWVRLAQRIPVKISLDKIPPGVRLASGMTATVEVIPTPAAAAPNSAGSK
jgi:RND family efflux transporter MFP subunit